jgi:hypothetical protein
LNHGLAASLNIPLSRPLVAITPKTNSLCSISVLSIRKMSPSPFGQMSLRRSCPSLSRETCRGNAILVGLCIVVLSAASPAIAAAAEPVTPVYLLGIPADFILFGLTLLGVAVFHHHTLPVALAGLAAITIYKLIFAGFKFGTGLGGLTLHMQHEWVILANLFLLLMGFAILSRHFEESRVPEEMPGLLPDDWKGGLALLAIRPTR